ncbi:MAG: hypothetical protein P8P74_12340 [Crocinitomicaceae bacterium]|nr:hypothetical protein [Crocinitomicaceae bacterium]
MKTAKRLLTSLILCASFFAYSQDSDYKYNKQPTYLDALRLEQIIEENATADHDESLELNQEFYGILNRYGMDSSSIKGNPFLMNYKINVRARDTSGPEILTSTIPGLADITEKPADKIVPSSSVPMNWEAAAINGIATFMGGRFKQEVLHMGIHQMFKRITERDSTLLADLFPKTFAQIIALRSQGTDAYYTADLLYLRELVNIDMENIPTNLVINIDDIFPKIKLKPDMKDGLLLTSDLLKYAEMGVPVDQLLNYASSAPYSSDSSLVAQLVNISDLLSQAFKDTEASGRIWVNPLVTLPHTGDPRSKDISKIFYGLLYSQLLDLKQFQDAFDKITGENNIEEAHQKISKIIQSISMMVNKMEMLANLIKQNNYEITNVSQAMSVIDELIDVVQSTSSTLNLLDVNTTKFDSVVALSHDFISFSESLIAKNYRSAIPKLVLILGTFPDDHVEMSRILGFIGGLGEINNDEDMEKLLQAYSLPIGSASIKRSSSFNLSVNSYVGFTGGIERAFAINSNYQDKGNVGLSAPIGISMTFANGHLTLFASVIDLGSIVNQRLNNDTTSYVDLRFEHFFTPGASLLYNFKNTPISLGAGVSYIPNLRTIKYSDGNAVVGESGLNVLRINASLLIDIPFFTIYNRPLRSEWAKNERKEDRRERRD